MNGAGSHSELLQDLDGAYSQLIRLQEVDKELKEANRTSRQTKYYGIVSETKHENMSSGQLINQEPCGVGNSSCHSFSIPFASTAAVTDSGAALASPSEQTHISIHRLIALNKA